MAGGGTDRRRERRRSGVRHRDPSAALLGVGDAAPPTTAAAAAAAGSPDAASPKLSPKISPKSEPTGPAAAVVAPAAPAPTAAAATVFVAAAAAAAAAPPPPASPHDSLSLATHFDSARSSRDGASTPVRVLPSPSSHTEKEECPICGDEIHLWGTWSNCGHNVCWICAMRLALQKKRKALHRCCLCKRPSRRMLIGKVRPRPEDAHKLDTYPIRTKRLHLDCVDRHCYDRVLEMARTLCGECGAELSSYAELTAHTRRVHGLSHCDVCVTHRPLFVKEQILFTARELSQHISTEKRDSSEVNHGHPVCYLCATYTYDSEALLNHVQNRHVMCGLCDHNGNEWVFFKDFTAFLQHCRAVHALCEACASSGSYDTAIHSSASELNSHQMTCPKKHHFQFSPCKKPPVVKKQPVGLRLLMGGQGWTMERPSGWNRYRARGMSKTIEWLASQLHKSDDKDAAKALKGACADGASTRKRRKRKKRGGGAAGGAGGGGGGGGVGGVARQPAVATASTVTSRARQVLRPARPAMAAASSSSSRPVTRI